MIFQAQIESAYKKMLFSRCNESDLVFYFSAKDFENLVSEPFSFLSSANDTLKGYFYYYGDKIPDHVVVFDHGMGAGHRAYMREIELLASHGYLVFSYDHTGCVESEGECTFGFGRSLGDLDACIKAIKEHPYCKGKKISVVGHSWGGFSTLNILALHPDICHIVAISGPISVRAMVEQSFSGIMKGYREHIMSIEREANPDYYHYNAVETLKDTTAEVMLIYSADDKVVKKASHYDPLLQALKDKPNVTLILTQGKAHNPNYTVEAVKYKDEFFKKLTKAQKKLTTAEQKKAFKESYDWYKMTEQDTEVWQRIFDTLNK